MVANETVYEERCSEDEGIVFKINFEKAYNHVKCEKKNLGSCISRRDYGGGGTSWFTSCVLFGTSWFFCSIYCFLSIKKKNRVEVEIMDLWMHLINQFCSTNN